MRQRGARRLIAALLAMALGLTLGGQWAAGLQQAALPAAPVQVADPSGSTGGNGG